MCAEAVDLARSAAEETGDGVGDHLSAEAEADRVVTHLFDCELPGYRGWRWAVVVARAPRARNVTVSEVALLPGPDALTAPVWVPWAERLRAGDVGVGDLLPTDEDDERLMPSYVLSEDDAVEDIAFELGVGRARVMSREGRGETAQRWYDGDRGPQADISVSAPADARCGTCGFYLPLAGSLRQVFGVCGNLYASDDAKVVSADHGCGAHSEVLTGGEVAEEDVEHLDTVYDDNLIEQVDPVSRDDETADQVVAVDSAQAKEPVADPVEPTAAAESPETETASVPEEPTVSGETPGEGDPEATRSGLFGGGATVAVPAAVVHDHGDGAGNAQRGTGKGAVDPPGAAGRGQLVGEEQPQDRRGDQPQRGTAQRQGRHGEVDRFGDGTGLDRWHGANLPGFPGVQIGRTAETWRYLRSCAL